MYHFPNLVQLNPEDGGSMFPQNGTYLSDYNLTLTVHLALVLHFTCFTPFCFSWQYGEKHAVFGTIKTHSLVL